MATTIINPAPNNNTSNNNGAIFLVGAIILVLVTVVVFVFALPYVRRLGGSGGIQVKVPENINVKVQQSK